MNVLVTGGAGFVGSHLVDALVARGDDVTVVDDLSTGLLANITKEKVNFRRGRAEHLYYPHPVPELIFHLAAQPRIQPSFRDPEYTLRTNHDSTCRMLELARKHGARVVYAGSSTFYGGVHRNAYAYSKWEGEELCRLYSKLFQVPSSIARFFNVYGPRQIDRGEYATVVGIFMRQKLAGEALTVTGTGAQRRDFTHVQDIVQGLLKMAEPSKMGGTYQLGTGKNYSINQVAAMFNPVDVRYLPARPGEAEETLAGVEETQETLGWTPTHSLPEDIAEWLQTHT